MFQAQADVTGHNQFLYNLNEPLDPNATVVLRVMVTVLVADEHFPRYWPFVRGFHRHRWIPRTERPVTRSFDVFFDMRLNKRLSI